MAAAHQHGKSQLRPEHLKAKGTPVAATEPPPATPPTPGSDAALENMRPLVTTTGHITWEASPEGDILEALPWRAFTGASEERLGGWGWLDAVHPDDRARVRAAWTDALARLAPFEAAYRLLRYDGQYRQVTHSAVPLRDATGAVREWAGVCVDHTSDTSQALHANDDRLRVLVEQAVDAILVADANWRYVEVNPSASELLGYTRDELLGMRIVDVVRPEDRERVAELEAELRRGATHRGEWWLVRKDGTLVPVEITSRLLADGRCQAIARDVTERKRLEAELQASAERYQTIVETANEGVWMVDAEGRTLYVNDRMARMLGHEAVAMAGTLITDYCPPEDIQVVRERFGHNLGGSFEQFECRFRHRDGHPVDVLACTSPARGAGGVVQGAFGMFTDISSRNALERERAAQAAQLLTTYDTMVDGVIVYDAEGHITHMNSALRRLFGLDAEPGYQGQSLMRRGQRLDVRGRDGQPIPEEQWPSTRVLRGEVLTGEHAVDYHVRNLRGEELDLNYTGAPLRDARGTITGAVMVIRDVTDRRRNERRTQEALATVLAMAETAVATPSVQKNAATGSQSAVMRHLAGLTRQFLQCERVFIATVWSEGDQIQPLATSGFPPEEETEWWTRSRFIRLSDYLKPAEIKRLRGGEVVVLDSPRAGLRGDPSFGTIQLLVVPLNIGGRLAGVMTIGYGDATHTYTPEELTLAHAIGRLAALVAERERLLVERAEAEAKLLALHEANERMDEFMGIASHELKTPVTSIKANLQILDRRLRVARQPGSNAGGKASEVAAAMRALDDALPLVQRAERGVERLTRLVNDLVDVSRIRSEKLALTPERIDLAEGIRDIVEEQRSAQPGRTITCEIEPPEGLTVVADADRIGQVLTNYLTNALKYSPAEHPIVVRARREAGHVLVSVRDFGPGLHPDEHEHIWDPFYRAAGISHQSGSGVGLGLGLHISKTIVERHGGEVGVTSSPGAGATFWFTLPLDEDG